MTKQSAKLLGEFQTTTAKHSTQCGLFCFENAACNSFDYNEKDSVCLLHQKQLADVDPRNVIADSDFGHYESREKRKKTTYCKSPYIAPVRILVPKSVTNGKSAGI